MDCIVAWYKSQLSIRIPIVSPIFQTRDVCGRHQIMGNARGPTQQMAKTIADVRKYQGRFFDAAAAREAAFRNSPQYLHFIAAS